MRALAILLLFGVLTVWTERTRAGQPSEQPRPTSESRQVEPVNPISRARAAWHESLARIKQIEGVQMVSAVLTGSQMGPGDGWFQAGKSRYSWQWLVERYDRDGDQVVTADEFIGPSELFLRLDRDRNGRVDGVDLQSKAVFIEAPKQKSGKTFEVLTPQAIAAVRGTKWAVDAEDSKTSVFVDTGRVGVRRPTAPGRVELGPGEGVDVDGGTAPLEVRHWPAPRVAALMARLGR